MLFPPFQKMKTGLFLARRKYNLLCSILGLTWVIDSVAPYLAITLIPRLQMSYPKLQLVKEEIVPHMKHCHPSLPAEACAPDVLCRGSRERGEENSYWLM
ncbi:hypothetical protein BDR03DRAFT_707630 [Suillus americanus]|nr:hypothetical protein BDR03DRAFT_707630 [Suillus americanus]